MMAGAPHPFAAILQAAAAGRFPPPDGLVEVLPTDGDTMVVCEFTAHSYLLAPVHPQQLAARHLHAFGACMHPETLQWLAGRERDIGTIDVLLVADGLGSGGAPLAAPDHPRVERALRFRSGVTVHGDDTGLAVLGRGVVGRWEVAVELFDDAPHGQGSGRRLAQLARAAAPAGEPLWAQVAPGNAASLRAFLAAGFRPVGSEVLLTPAADARHPRWRTRVLTRLPGREYPLG